MYKNEINNLWQQLLNYTLVYFQERFYDFLWPFTIEYSLTLKIIIEIRNNLKFGFCKKITIHKSIVLHHIWACGKFFPL